MFGTNLYKKFQNLVPGTNFWWMIGGRLSGDNVWWTSGGRLVDVRWTIGGRLVDDWDVKGFYLTTISVFFFFFQNYL